MIDVCVVTRDGSLPTGLEYVPMKNLIVETSKPLGIARMKAIQQVSTERFVFIDDDVIIDKDWFAKLSQHFSEKVGAVQGRLKVVGLGKAFDDAVNQFNGDSYDLKVGQRGYTHNTLLRTDLVKDWKPSSPDLSAGEDFEITQHILNKGFSWRVVPTNSSHIWSWPSIVSKACWQYRTMKHRKNAPSVRINNIRFNISSIIMSLFNLRFGVHFFVHQLFFYTTNLLVGVFA